MSVMQIVVLVLLFVVVMTLVGALLLLLRPNEGRKRLRQLAADERRDSGELDDGWMKLVADLTRPISDLAAPQEGYEKSSVKRRFVHAGIRNPLAPTVFFGLKTALTLGLPLLAFAAFALTGMLPKGNNLLLLLLLAALGYYAPNLVLQSMVTRRQREIFESFPDALDLMTVCVEAGLGTEAAIMRVAKDIQVKSPALGDELRLVNLELRAGSDRERALRNLALRTGVDEIDGFVSMINQAERFGTSIAASLRIQSELLRTRRRQRAEETAAKIALKLLFPLIFCIFPSLMVVLMGPAMIQIYRVLLPAMSGNN